MKRLLVVLLAGLAGCTSTSTVTANDPQPTGTTAKAKAAIMSAVRNPSSVQGLRIGSPYRATKNFFYPGAWAVCASFTGQNGFGGYTRGNYLVFFRDNRAIDVKGGPDVVLPPECGALRAA
jgi:hypothetical protein